MGSIDSNSKQDDIFISKLKDLEIKRTFGTVEFDMGQITHSKYGSALVKGSLPLYVPEGTVKIASLELKKKVFNYITGWFVKNKLNFCGEDKEKLIWVALDTLDALNPVDSFPLDSPATLTVIALVILAFYFDDLLENTFLENQISFAAEDSSGSTTRESAYSQMVQIINDTISGKFKSVKDLPKFEFPMLQPTLWLAFFSNEHGNLCDQNFNTSPFLKHLFKEQWKTAKSTFILGDHEFLDKCSNLTYSSLREYDVGGRVALEGALFLLNVNLPKESRSNLIFKRARSGLCKLLEWTNDLFGIEKDFSVNVPSNIILRKVAMENYTLQEGVDLAVHGMRDELNDLVECWDKLAEIYPEVLGELAGSVKYTLDAQIRFYAMSERYGKPKLTYKYD